jgi:aryl-alcohol dehydrogenase-like predicted oxidoreductase
MENEPMPPQSEASTGTGQLVLGTVQLGLPYGRRRNEQPMSESMAFGILDHAWASGMRSFDTAEAYGASPRRLAAWLERHDRAAGANIITKVKPTGSRSDVSVIAAAVEPFRRCNSLLLLTHGFVPLASWSSLLEMPELTSVDLGQSVYDPWEVEALLRLPRVARAQVPGSLIDNRALDARGDSPLPLDIRSVFLQGLLLESPADAERRVRGMGPVVAVVDTAARRFRDHSRPALLARAFLLQLAPTDRLVVGVDAPHELDQILGAFAVPEDVACSFSADVRGSLPPSLAPSLFDPRSWT